MPIGNPGNPADTRDSANGFGSVAYPYRIGTTEVTNAQYTAFLNAVAASDPYGLYNTNMGSQTYGGIVRSGASGSFSYAVKRRRRAAPIPTMINRSCLSLGSTRSASPTG